MGRSDKKFCSDACRNTFNNKKTGSSNAYIRRVNNLLRRNRKILLDLNPGGKAKTTQFRLLEMGFNFHYFTNIYETKAGRRYYFCYDQGYIELEDGWYSLVHKQDYVE